MFVFACHEARGSLKPQLRDSELGAPVEGLASLRTTVKAISERKLIRSESLRALASRVASQDKTVHDVDGWAERLASGFAHGGG